MKKLPLKKSELRAEFSKRMTAAATALDWRSAIVMVLRWLLDLLAPVQAQAAATPDDPDCCHHQLCLETTCAAAQTSESAITTLDTALRMLEDCCEE